MMKNEDLVQFSDDSFNADQPETPILPGNNDLAESTTPSKSLPDRASENDEKASDTLDTIAVHNEKVRYYCNKTLHLRQPIEAVLDMLENLHRAAFAYMSQLPLTGDYSIISTLFELIPTVSVMIPWDSLNHSCYREDFCRETKQLMQLLDKANGAVLKCGDKATSLLQDAQSLFSGISHTNENERLRGPLCLNRAIFRKNDSDYTEENTSSQNIQINWQKPGDEIELTWHDADDGLINISLNQTGSGFRLRFLRHIIYHARTLLERAYLTFMKVNVSLHLHIPIEKLLKCKDVNLQQLSLEELDYLANAKDEFDSFLHLVWQMVSRFKFQTFHLLKYGKTFKEMRGKKSGFTPKTVPTFTVIKMNVNDSLLMRVMTSGIQAQANKESFDFTVFPDRTEDIISKIEDLLAVDNSSYKQLQTLLKIAAIMLPSEKSCFTKKEWECIGDQITMIMDHRFQVRRYLKLALQLFEKHNAFYKMEQLKLLTPMKHMKKAHSFEASLNKSSGGSESEPEAHEDPHKTDLDANNNEVLELDSIWIRVEGGVEVTTDRVYGVVTKSPSNNNSIRGYHELTKDERIILCMRVIKELLIFMANEHCSVKINTERIRETKSLVKRLKVKDRQSMDLQKVILEHNKYMRLMLQLTKTMRFLKE